MHLPFLWAPGQHLALVGLTGSGKSTLAAYLLKSRRYVLVLRTKADSVDYQTLKFKTAKSALTDIHSNRVELFPRFDDREDEFRAALKRAFRQGGWTIYVDELWILSEKLGLDDEIEEILTQGREPGRITFVAGMQRPVDVTRFALGEATHIVSFGVEGRDGATLGEVVNRRYREAVEELDQHEFATYSRTNRRIWSGKLSRDYTTLIPKREENGETLSQLG